MLLNILFSSDRTKKKSYYDLLEGGKKTDVDHLRAAAKFWKDGAAVFLYEADHQCFSHPNCVIMVKVREKKAPAGSSHHSECCNILWRCEKVVRVKYGHVSGWKASANAPCCPFAHQGKIVVFKGVSTGGNSQVGLYFSKLRESSSSSSSSRPHTVSNSVPLLLIYIRIYFPSLYIIDFIILF